MQKQAATARIHCRPTIRHETARALIEMIRLAAKQFHGYEGPIVVEILPDRESFYRTFEPHKNLTNRKLDTCYE